MHQQLLAGAPVVFDERVRVRAPALVEDALNVPVSVQWSGLGDVREVLVFADLNPIQPILRLHPAGTAEFIGFRFKVEQSTPVRAAVRTGDGTWYLGGRWLSAAGGGCTAPSEARADTGWERQLGEVRARRFDRPGAVGGRLRFQVMHPMDTGLAAGIPEFFLEELTLAGADGRTLTRIEPYQPLSANPLFTLDLPDGTSGPLQLRGRDNNGNRVESLIEP
jgi:sulfur-oxidizing protein SoxY